MKNAVHRNLLEGLSVLIDRYGQGAHPEQAMETLFRHNRQWGRRDRQWIKDMFFHYLRYRNLIDEMAAQCLPSVPHARALATLVHRDANLAASLELDEAQKACLLQTAGRLQSAPPYRWGIDEGLWPYFEKIPSGRREKILENLNRPSLPVIRINTLKIQPEAFKKMLDAHDYRWHEGPLPETVIFDKSYRLTGTPWYKQGLFELQDTSSQAVVDFAAPRPGQTVVDACAGAGGKTLHLAARMQNQGRLVALDILPEKLRNLRARARRAGVKNLVYAGLPGDEILHRYQGQADLVLVDAPCSSSGTYKRKPHRKWALNREAVEKIIGTQRHVLDSYARLVRPGGTLIYATCSVLPDENQNQVKSFLERNNDFIFVDESFMEPGVDAGDGFYMARLKRKEK